MTTEANSTIENHSIPDVLRNRPQWKVSDEKNAGWGWNIAENLRTYDTACDHALKVGADGVIYVVLESDPHTWIDLDNVRDPQTGHIEPWAQEIIDRLDSYTEISGSGRGVHIAVEASKPGGRVKTHAFPGLEMYDRVRPMRVTGNRLNSNEIQPRQAEIDSLYHKVFPPETDRDPVEVEPTGLSDVEVLDKLLTEDNGPKWSATLNGAWGEHYGSQSDADYAIAGKLAFYSGDQEQVERLMNHSGLYRAKFDTMRGPVTYLQQTIGRVFDKLDTTYTPPSSLRMTVGQSRKPRKGLLADAVKMGDLMRDGIEPPDELIPGVLLAGQVHQIFCGPGKGKSWLALWMAVRLVNRGLRVLYLDKENGPRMIRNRLVALGADPSKVDQCLVYVPFPPLDLDPNAVQDYINTLDGFSLVIFDSWINYLAAAGLDENSNGDLARWSTTFCAEARSRGISVLLLDHVGKDSSNGSRGASRKLDEMDVAWELRTVREFDRQQPGMIQLRRKKDREAWLSPTVEFEIGGNPFVMKRVDGFEIQEPDSVKNTLKAIEGFGADGARHGNWLTETESLGTKKTQFNTARDALLNDGRVVRVGRDYFAAQFSPGAQPDKTSDDLVREPEPDQTGQSENKARLSHQQRESLSGRGAGQEEKSSPQFSPVRVPSLSGDRAGQSGPGIEETDLWEFVNFLPPEILPPQADVDELRQRYGPEYTIRTPQELMSTYLRDGYAKPKFRIRDGQRVLVGLVAS